MAILANNILNDMELTTYSIDGLLVFIECSEIDSEARIDASEVSG